MKRKQLKEDNRWHKCDYVHVTVN